MRNPEVKAWVDEIFDGDEEFAQYFNLAKDRTKEDVLDLAKVRTWKVRLFVAVCKQRVIGALDCFCILKAFSFC